MSQLSCIFYGQHPSLVPGVSLSPGQSVQDSLVCVRPWSMNMSGALDICQSHALGYVIPLGTKATNRIHSNHAQSHIYSAFLKIYFQYRISMFSLQLIRTWNLVYRLRSTRTFYRSTVSIRSSRICKGSVYYITTSGLLNFQPKSIHQVAGYSCRATVQ